MERKTGLEPATPTLARLCSTTELLPHLLNSDIIISQFCLLSSLIFSDRTDVSLGIQRRLILYHIVYFVSTGNFHSVKMFISLSALSLCDEKYYIRFCRILQVVFEKIFGMVFRARFGRQPISRPCDRHRLRLQQKGDVK